MAYLTQERIEDSSWVNHYTQVAREEEESELADEFETKFRFGCFRDMFAGSSADNKAITDLLNDDSFQEKAYEFLRYAAEELAAKQVDINMALRSNT
ncbi:host-nuclease inhibitor Gam family protein [Atlantibacter hermannii]|uniref:host-nuclease inhibitor Gam family protein n=1 Tax=Atlantibacter hermannii TaxID=565 RepID=UPI0028B17D6D|nr:host-nuclease inhibitor Gam family protein [Atlantibacter hermannii]